MLKPKYQTFPVVRITLIGPPKSGKSSIADAFTNNHFSGGFYSNLPEIVRLPTGDSNNSDPISVCVEIEDLPGIESSYINNQFINRYFNMNRRELFIPPGTKDIIPFRIWNPPKIPLIPGQKYQPLTQGRMGFIFVMDINDIESIKAIELLYQKFQSISELTVSSIKPVVFLCANKVDNDIETKQFEDNLFRVEEFASKMFLRLWKVSALTGNNIKHMFRDMLHLINSNSSLWQIDLRYISESSDSDSEEESIISDCIAISKMSSRGGRGGGNIRGIRGSPRGRSNSGSSNRPSFSGPPSSIKEVGEVMHSSEHELVCKSLLKNEVPYFNGRIFLENKEEIGKVDEILGPINTYYFSLKMISGVNSESFKEGTKVFIDPQQLLPITRFLPKPSNSKTNKNPDTSINKKRGGFSSRGSNRGGRGRGISKGSPNRGGFRGRG
ncbi:Ras family [Cryptosporidium xiaoi]|uniref:Ras family n=1 Tax=Cryptosporidium xiaoi TaxID=659607 RepID=A0AAV9Y2F5_9CRYT